ncbi:hypothetical protein M514_18830 [Trichuris suis]|uniref:Uncharacterized protein n=1 Tax=Trichuris suis TaxID=68888 RepID=A0A085M5E0_9BILA|nr:hypothetical protein M513_06629 [Trichuris suis]KFD52436.1 hypothetical protein M513_06633 [Trichuris suis]KFD69027.1 hypothetical protein M514_18830 [Trichuris suis]
MAAVFRRRKVQFPFSSFCLEATDRFSQTRSLFIALCCHRVRGILFNVTPILPTKPSMCGKSGYNASKLMTAYMFSLHHFRSSERIASQTSVQLTATNRA